VAISTVNGTANAFTRSNTISPHAAAEASSQLIWPYSVFPG
jgi:hypothetical protein